ncbi:sugar transporter [Gluconacetobacter diazotrophicus PA1 5]|uniref:Sugar porter family MFS transporter n=2 Tax=Gluconacetobacter diazotrophicus TaxID=33996 RepID=A0A7W4FCQ2_GLUDI|nr:sugar porter family MFS transporter [Gluconacetobacter diazotrophicus]ACI51712.1 sugar transporter [Gluconacetobacter diazotrophicus PA1 5]MBB2155248.1 sugar porter family MFS transporter [Gluconacetobacter diazotrophicus]TWB11056.1 sugar porter (SP) family MFS transporter [Gluconacetobacter diazotrophicus]CAP55184.1 putative sugar-proton symporter [Gluconacetobacter diazotrophicus PA1 5]
MQNFSPQAPSVPALSDFEVSDNAGRTLWLAAAVAAICGGLYGYDTGIISGALLLITRDFHLGSLYQELVASAILAGAVLGAVGTGWLSERFGRRTSVMIVTAVFVTGALACAAAPDVDMLIAARVYLGLGVGGSTQVVPMYISELAPAARRGKLVTLFNVAIGIGIFVANIIGFAARDAWGWRPMIAVAALPAALVFVSMFFLPKSPRWTAENEGLDSAVTHLARVRTSRKEVRKEIRRIHEAAEDVDDAHRGWRGLMQPWVRPALVAALGVAFFTQCGGLEMMIYYAPTFLSDAGFGHSSALLASLGVSMVYLVMTMLGSAIVDHVGRRRLMLIMGPGSVASLLGLGLMFAIHPDKGSVGSWMIIVFLLMFMAFNSGGIQVVGWLLGAEMFPLSMRGTATSLHAATLWGSDLLVTSTALTLVNLISLGGTMWFYAGVNLASVAFIYFLVPETRGASLEDIETALHEGRFRPTRGHTAIVET